jgi:hypothetical protein
MSNTDTATLQWGTMKSLGHKGATTLTVAKSRNGTRYMDCDRRPLPPGAETMVVTVHAENNNTFFTFRNEDGEWVGNGGAASRIWAVPAS